MGEFLRYFSSSLAWMPIRSLGLARPESNMQTQSQHCTTLLNFTLMLNPVSTIITTKQIKFQVLTKFWHCMRRSMFQGFNSE